jgi:hypothetical protein
MTQNVQAVIQQYGELTRWFQSLIVIHEEKWRMPITEGKWSPGEVIAHLQGWDQYLKDVVIVDALKGEVKFPDHDDFNAKSSKLALTGITQSFQIEVAVQTRLNLVKELLQLSEQDLLKKCYSQ